MPFARARWAIALLSSAVAGACASAPASSSPRPTPPEAGAVLSARTLLETLAADSLQGRRPGTMGEVRAARLIAAQMRAIGLQPAGDSGYAQRIPIATDTVTMRSTGTFVRKPRGLASFADRDTVPARDAGTAVNVLGWLPGTATDRADGGEGDPGVVLVVAHHDHAGAGLWFQGQVDTVFHGADDNASGVVALLEAARTLASGPRLRRSVLLVTLTGEEWGGFGTSWYLRHPRVPLARTAAVLNLEMLGRPDSLAGGRGGAWLTGHARSTMGAAFAARGLRIVADPRPDQHFYERSDNYAFARAGVPAHTLSSFALHPDYHHPNDTADRIDYAHLAAVTATVVAAVRVLADGPAPTWTPGGRPQP